MQRLFALAGAGVLLAGLPAHGDPLGDPLPESRRIDWAVAGVPGGIPHRSTVCATFMPGATAAEINAAITSCKDGVVALGEGTFSAVSLGGPIVLSASNVTLRGAGADKTILTGGHIISLGRGGTIAVDTAITGGGLKDSRDVTLASVAELTVGTMIEIDREDDASLVVNTGKQGGGTRNITQLNAIAAISGTKITLRNPLFHDFSQGEPRVKARFLSVRRSGVEDLKLDHAGFSGGYSFLVEYCDSCWVKGVESVNVQGYHFVLLGTLNVELRDSFIHVGGGGPNNSGINFYGNYQYGANSSALIENTIFNRVFPAIELNGSSSGFTIAYNYSHGTPEQGGSGLVTWTFDDGHAPFNVRNLYEGNIAEMWGSDSYFGGSGYGVALRNHFTGFNPLHEVASEAVWLGRLAYNYSLVGNVLGSPQQAATAYAGCGTPAIYRLGYPNLGNCSASPWDGFAASGGYPDPKVAETLLRWGNYDHFNAAARFEAAEIPAGVPVPADQALPASYRYAEKPAWWPADPPWPPIGPDVTGGDGDASGHVYKTPALRCWDKLDLKAGGAFSASRCYPPAG
ncbi:MAG: hypothetical protein AB7J30_07650 [Hyphomicrobium sp.]|uniref:hypothetical protein n=1 Tax=Hyphomicrobium sp. TaxID=82 RepID=UPI003D139D2E